MRLRAGPRCSCTVIDCESSMDTMSEPPPRAPATDFNTQLLERTALGVAGCAGRGVVWSVCTAWQHVHWLTPAAAAAACGSAADRCRFHDRRPCRLACAVYLLQSLPAILFPTGLLASVLTLLAGVTLGLMGAAAAVVSWRPRRRICGPSGAAPWSLRTNHYAPSCRRSRSFG